MICFHKYYQLRKSISTLSRTIISNAKDYFTLNIWTSQNLTTQGHTFQGNVIKASAISANHIIEYDI